MLQRGNSPVRAGSRAGMDDLGYSALQLLLAATTFLGNTVGCRDRVQMYAGESCILVRVTVFKANIEYV